MANTFVGYVLLISGIWNFVGYGRENTTPYAIVLPLVRANIRGILDTS